MNIWESFSEAVDSIYANKMRSSLTMLGIVIGVAAVIAMLAIGAGAQDSIIGEIEGVGTNLLYISPDGQDVSNPSSLTLSDMEALQDSGLAPSIAAVAGTVSSFAEVSYARETDTLSVTGVTSDYLNIQNLDLSEGEPISDAHLTGRSSVAVIGANVAENYFDRAEGVLGESIRIAGNPYRVIGVIKEQGGSNFGSADDQILIPLTTAQIRLNTGSSSSEVSMIYVSAVSPERVPDAIEEISMTLRERHRSEIGEEDFQIISQQSFLDMASTITGILTIFLGGVAAISLLVGGIGIMNIMLVSVVERTKEIGLRKALGARKRDILSQFLIESSVLSIVGGILGILFGRAISAIVGQIASASEITINPIVGLDAILLATIFSAAVGIFFGIYPANRAASLEPVEALRTD